MAEGGAYGRGDEYRRLPAFFDGTARLSGLCCAHDYEAARAAYIAHQPIGCIGRAEAIAALVVYLASDECAYTIGVAHVIDGGWSNTQVSVVADLAEHPFGLPVMTGDCHGLH